MISKKIRGEKRRNLPHIFILYSVTLIMRHFVLDLFDKKFQLVLEPVKVLTLLIFGDNLYSFCQQTVTKKNVLTY